jgi:hypothetical protein
MAREADGTVIALAWGNHLGAEFRLGAVRGEAGQTPAPRTG